MRWSQVFVLIALTAMIMLSGCRWGRTDCKFSSITMKGSWKVTGVIPLDTYSPEAYQEENDSCAYTRILISDTSFVVRDRYGNMTFDVKDSAYSEINTYTGCMCSMRLGFGYRLRGWTQYQEDSAKGQDERFLNVVYGPNKYRNVPVFRSNYGYDNCGEQDSIDFYLSGTRLIIYDCGRLVVLEPDTDRRK
jgi:hypothetical protein